MLAFAVGIGYDLAMRVTPAHVGWLAMGLVACGRIEAKHQEHDAAVANVDGNPQMVDAPPSGPAVLVVAPLDHMFGPVSLTAASTPITVTFTNTGGEPATGCSAPQKGGANPTEFEITNDTCGTSDLAGGTSCTISVAARPTADGLRTATVSRSCTVGGLASTTADQFVANKPMYIFAATTMTNGNLGGLAGADATCAARGAAGTTSSQKGVSTWKALISTKTGTQVNAKDRFVWTGPMYSMTGQMITRNPSAWPWAATGTGGDPRRDENNTQAQSYVWSGSTVDGVAAAADCNAWTDGTTAFNGHAGETASFPSTAWLDSYNNGCSDTFFGLYCVSQ